MKRPSSGQKATRDLVEAVLAQKLTHAQVKELLHRRLGQYVSLLYDLYDSKTLSQAQQCKCLVAFTGLQVLRDPDIRSAILANAPAEQVRVCFAALLEDEIAILSADKIDEAEKRARISSKPWHSGSGWARRFCESFFLPLVLAGREFDSSVGPYENVSPFIELPGLHDYQIELQQNLLATLAADRAARALVALPTGAGKTRLLVDTAFQLDDGDAARHCVMWIAQHDELCEQAVQCFAQAWRSRINDGNRSLVVQRVWRSLNREIDWNSDIIVGTPESLIPRLQACGREERSRIAISIIDEAHHALAPTYDALFSLLGGSPIVGITATPGSASEDGFHRLRKRFGNKVLISALLGPNPVGELQDRRILSIADYESISTNVRLGSEILDTDEIESFGDLPPKVLKKLGDSASRNKTILNRLLNIHREDGAVLCFAPSVASARVLAAALVASGRTACSIDSDSESWSRAEAIIDFRNGNLQFLVNYGVLATGFDAPKVSVLVLARPTTSAVLFEQMLGRGLRGPLNGGTEFCKIIYFEDDFTGFGGVEPQSYMRWLKNELSYE